MKTWATEYIFNNSWETVLQAVWRKYPNPHKPEVMGLDIMERQVMGGILHSQRIIASRFGLPTWSRKLLGSDDICYAFEVSQVDPVNKMMTIKTRNLTFNSAVSVLESITYKPAPLCPKEPHIPRTLMIQQSRVVVHVAPFTEYLEDTILSSIARNCHKGHIAMEHTLSQIMEEAVLPESERSSSRSLCQAAQPGFDTLQGSLTMSVVDEMSHKAKKSVEELSEISGKALELSGKALKSVDEISGMALKSVDEISEKALRSVDEFSDKALKSVDEISGKALKSVDEISEKAKALRSVRLDRAFDDVFNVFL